MKNSINKHLGSIWTEIVEHLSLRQLDACMGNGLSDYKAKAIKVKKVSKSIEVHALADQLINVYDAHFSPVQLTVSKDLFKGIE